MALKTTRIPSMNPAHTKVAAVGASPLPASAAKSATAGGEPVRREKSVGADGRKVAVVGQAATDLSQRCQRQPA